MEAPRIPAELGERGIDSRRVLLRRVGFGALGCVALSYTGCSLGVMMGKMFIGDPMTDSAFEAYTKKTLAEEGKRVAVICSSPEALKLEMSSLDMDLLSNVALRMRQHEINIVEPHEVARWIDDNGGAIDLLDLGTSVEADYIVHIQIEEFTYKEENSPNLFRGRSSGNVSVYELVPRDAPEEKKPKKKFDKKKDEDEKKSSKKDSEKDTDTKSGKKKSGNNSDDNSDEKRSQDLEVKLVFARGFASVYPNHQPISAESVSATVFRKRYLDRVAEEVARTFYKQLTGSDI